MAASDGDSVGAVAADFWEWQLQERPEMATALGDHRFDGRLTDLSVEAAARRGMEARALMRRLDELGPQAGEDAVTADVLRHHLIEPIDADRVCLAEIAVDEMDGPQVSFPRLMARHPLRDEGDLANLAARYQTFPIQMEQYISNLRAGLAKRRAAPGVVVERVMAQLRDLLAEQPSSSVFVQGRPNRFHTELSIVTSQCVFPGYRALLEFLERDYLPRARADMGLWALPGGPEVYAFAIRQRAGTRQSPAELHQAGVQELERIERELRALVGQPDRRSLERWKEADPRFANREELLAGYRRAVERFHDGLPAGFTRFPPLALHVEAIPGFMEQGAAPVHYEPPSGDGARPALLLVNASRAEARPRYPVEALVAHEAAPGRHLMLSVAPAPSGLPPVRRVPVPGFSEGWAMYAERLVDELGLYSDDRARLGMLLAQSWRAAQLVVDTGVHALKWTREHAIEYLLEISVAARPEAEVEVDRTIVRPALGMADAAGALALAAARADAEQALGARFSRQAFHDRLLASGPLPLQAMRRAMLEWSLNPDPAPPGPP